jgi:hypothetical protein
MNLDELRVESFTTAKPEEMRGTVKGRDESSCGEVCTCDCGSEMGDCAGSLFPVMIAG